MLAVEARRALCKSAVSQQQIRGARSRCRGPAYSGASGLRRLSQRPALFAPPPRARRRANGRGPGGRQGCRPSASQVREEAPGGQRSRRARGKFPFKISLHWEWACLGRRAVCRALLHRLGASRPPPWC